MFVHIVEILAYNEFRPSHVTMSMVPMDSLATGI